MSIFDAHVLKIKEAGAVNIGKTVMDELEWVAQELQVTPE